MKFQFQTVEITAVGSIMNQGSLNRERKPLFLETGEFFARLRNVCNKASLKVPEHLFGALAYCGITKEHLLIDVSSISPNETQSASNYNETSATVHSLVQIVPLLLGLKCVHVPCDKLTTPEYLIHKVVAQSDDSVQHGKSQVVEEKEEHEFNVIPVSLSNSAPIKIRKKSKEKSPAEIQLFQRRHSRTASVSTPTPADSKISISSKRGSQQGPLSPAVMIVENLESAPPHTQEALLELMSNQQVVLHGYRYTTPDLFMVVVIIGASEYEQTYPINNHMLDKFLMKIDIMKPITASQKCSEVTSSALSGKDVEYYIRNIVFSLRVHPLVFSGVSPMATMALETTARVVALLFGQRFVTPSHVLSVAGPVLGHRFELINSMRQATPLDVVDDVLDTEIPPV